MEAVGIHRRASHCSEGGYGSEFTVCSDREALKVVRKVGGKVTGCLHEAD